MASLGVFTPSARGFVVMTVTTSDLDSQKDDQIEIDEAAADCRGRELHNDGEKPLDLTREVNRERRHY